MGFRRFLLALTLSFFLCSTSHAVTKPTVGAKIDTSHPLANDLAACWLFNENSGSTVNDSTANNNTGTLLGNTNWVTGNFNGPALDFNETLGRINYPGGIHTDYLTFIVWFRRPAANFVGQDVFSSDNNGVVSWQVFGQNALSSLRVRIDTAGGFTTLDSDGFVTANKWHQYVATYDGTNIKVYVDGALNKSIVHSNPGIIRTTGLDRTFGVWPTLGAAQYIGQMDMAMIWNRALTASEISLLYSDPFLMFEKGENRRAIDSITELPIQGATVTLYTATGSIYTGRPQPNPTTTDADGYYTLEAGPGMYYITATKEGYEDFKSGIFTVNSPVNQPITMIPLDQSEGKVFSLIHTPDKKIASIGDVLTYKIATSNLTTNALDEVTVETNLPHGMRLVREV